MTDSQYPTLLSPYRLGPLDLKNRLVMAPMTRSRAVEGNVANPLAATYYAQRASAGLIISEATQISPQGVGYIRTPGIHSPEQVEGWRKVTDAVHAAGGKIFAQIWHVGRVSHPEFHGGALPVAPSAIAGEGEVYTSQGRVPLGTPRALETEEIPGIVEDFRKAALNAIKAGFEGVEIHGSAGYLLDQFLRDGSNKRIDRYGGSLENRARFPLEVATAVVEAVGAERVGYRVAPNLPVHGMSDSDPKATFTYLAGELDRLGLAYLHVFEPVAGPAAPPPEVERVAPYLRKTFSRSLILCGGYDAASGEAAVASGAADLVAYGVPFIANPDLVERYRQGAELNAPDFASFYGSEKGDAAGYTNYPKLSSESA